KTVSSQHCEIGLQDGIVLLRDLGSTNGIIVGDLRIQQGIAKLGTRIRIGHTELVIKAAGKQDLLLAATDRFGSLYGKSAPMRALFAQLEVMARSSAPVLLEGETGTGKDVAAAAIHRASARADGPLVVFDCAASAGSLIASELF